MRSFACHHVTRICGTALFCAVLLAVPAGDARAADASDWVGDARSAARLISGTFEKGASARRAGVEIRLAPGWKTYWRYPGDSGVPPHFDFAGSDNVRNVTVQWPAPQKITDSEGVIIGYKTGVIFPLNVEPSDPAKPVVLRLKLDYAICEKLCIPVDAKTELPLSGAASSQDANLSAAQTRVPKAAELGKSATLDGPIAIVSMRRDGEASPPRILVDVKAPAGTELELFAEGPSADWALPVPEPVAGAPAGLQRFAFALDGLPPGASAKGAVLKLTARAGENAIESSARLD